eukprot:638617_1
MTDDEAGSEQIKQHISTLEDIEKQLDNVQHSFQEDINPIKHIEEIQNKFENACAQIKSLLSISLLSTSIPKRNNIFRKLEDIKQENIKHYFRKQRASASIHKQPTKPFGTYNQLFHSKQNINIPPSQMAAQGYRSGKFRHVYGERRRRNKQFHGLRPLTHGEANYISANDTFFAVSNDSARGSVYIIPLNKPSTLHHETPLLSVHSGSVLDHDFHPFIPNIISTVGNDCIVRITAFPMDGLSETITSPHISMTGHTKKISLCTFNPCANSILATASCDQSIKLWNIETESNIITFNECMDRIYSMEWNYNGSRLAMAGKDKVLRIFDPRVLNQTSVTYSFEGRKSQKVFWIDNMRWIGATGFSKVAKRQIKFWDVRKMWQPILTKDIDQSASVLMPYYDHELGILFYYGKGDGSVQYGEIINDSMMLYHLGMYRDVNPQKGGCFVPKRICDVGRCEMNRFLKLTKTSVEPISFMVPRKDCHIFDKNVDIFPDDYGGIPALNSSEWMNNINCDPIKITMN